MGVDLSAPPPLPTQKNKKKNFKKKLLMGRTPTIIID